jgi:hypothetical protein
MVKHINHLYFKRKKMILTAFRGSGVREKVIYPYREDHSFDFLNVEIDLSDFENGILEIGEIMKNEFVLNYPLQRSIRTKRDQAHLQNLIAYKLDYLFLDFDDVESEETAFEIGQVMENFGYTFVLFKSRSYGKVKDGQMIFNLKGLLFVDISFDMNIIQHTLESLDSVLREEIFENFKLDTTMKNFSGYQAPLKRAVEIVAFGKGENMNQIYTNGNIDEVEEDWNFDENDDFDFKESENFHPNDFQNDNEPEFTQPVAKKVKEDPWRDFLNENLPYVIIENLRYRLGFKPLKINGNGTIQFCHPDENTRGGYYSFFDDQLVIRHPVREKNIYLEEYISDLPEYLELADIFFRLQSGEIEV